LKFYIRIKLIRNVTGSPKLPPPPAQVDDAVEEAAQNEG
jgi:hypothetical protein